MIRIEKYDKAKKVYDDYIRDHPDDVRGYGGRGDANQFLQSYEEAISDYTQVIRLAPRCLPALHNIALCHAKLKKYDEAIRDLNYLVSMDASYMPAYGTRADVHEANGDIDKAADDYMKVLQFDPANVDALVGLGKLAMKRKDFDDATEVYKRVIKLDPDQPNMAANLGNLGQTANVVLGKRLNDHPHIEAYRSLAVIAYERQDWARVIPYLDKAKDLEIDNDTYQPEATNFLMRGATLFNQGDIFKSYTYLDKAIQLDPKCVMAHFMRAEVNLKNQFYDKALRDFKTYLQLLTEDSKTAAETGVTAEVVLLLLERIVRVSKLSFMKANNILTRHVLKKDAAKPKLIYQESAAPRDPIQELFVGLAEEQVEGSTLTSEEPQVKYGKYDEGEEVIYDERLEQVGRMPASEREAIKTRQKQQVAELSEVLQSGKYNPELKAIENIKTSVETIQQLQAGYEILPPLLQESCIKNIDQVLEVAQKHILTSPVEQQKA